MNHDGSTTVSVSGPDMAGPPAIGPVFDIKRFLWLRGPMMVAVALVLSIPTLIAVWFLVPVGYTASAQIRMMSTEPFVLNPEKDNTPYTTYVSTQIALITGNTVLSRVLDSPEVSNLPLLALQTDPLEYIKKCVSASATRGSEIITITCSMPEKDAALITLEKIVSEYTDYATREAVLAGNERLAWLTQERDTRQTELDAQKLRISQLQGSMGIPLVGQTPIETGEAQLFNESLVRAEEDLVKAENAVEEVHDDIALVDDFIAHVSKDSPIYDFGVEERVSADSRVGALRGEVVMVQARLAGMEDMEKANLPVRKIEEKRLTSLRENLSEVELEVRKEVLESLRTQMARQAETLTKSLEEVRQRVEKYTTLVDEYKGRIENTTDQYAQIQDLEEKTAETRGILEEVRSNIATIRVESNAPARVRLIAPATVPAGGPDYMPRFMAMVVGLAASMGFAGALGLWRELMDQQVRSSQDVGRLTDLPVIATIPHADEDSLPEATDIALVSEQAPLSALADAYRRVLAWVLHPEGGGDAMKSLLIVSPTRGDGKSALAGNLGVVLARSGRQVLLVDMSYRRPTWEALFDLPRSEGLAEVLNKSTTVDERIRSTRVPGLSVLGPGLDTSALAGRLASREMSEFLEYAESRVDHVILDTTPWLIMADASLLTPLVKSVVVVVGSSASTLGMVRRCLRELKETDANVIGVVLNGARRTAGGYMRANQKLYYGYADEKASSSGKAAPETTAEAAESAEEPDKDN